MTADTDVTGLVERLRKWDRTPHEGDPMVDRLLDDVSAAAEALEAAQRASSEADARVADAVAAERARCAKIAGLAAAALHVARNYELASIAEVAVAEKIAAAIRSQSQPKPEPRKPK